MNPKEFEVFRENLAELVKTNRMLVKQQTFWYAFFRGIFTAAGATIGATIVLAMFSSFLQQLLGLELIRPAVESVLPYVDQTKNSASQKSLPAPIYVNSPAVSPTSEVSPTPETAPSSSPENEQ